MIIAVPSGQTGSMYQYFSGLIHWYQSWPATSEVTLKYMNKIFIYQKHINDIQMFYGI